MTGIPSLKKRFMMLGASICLLLLIAGGGVGYFMLLQFRTEISSRNLTLVQSLASEISILLNKPVENLGKVQAEFERIPALSSIDRQKLLHSMVVFDDFVDQAQYFDRAGRLLLIEPPRPDHVGLDYGNHPFITNLSREQRVYWSDVFLSATTGNPATTVSFLGGNGILAAKFDLSGLQTIIDVLPPEHGGFIALVDRGGRVIAHTNRTIARQNVSLLGNASVQSAVRGKTDSLVETIDGQKGLTSFAPIATNGWAVLVFQPAENAFGAAYRSIGLALGLLVIGVGAISILSYFFFQRLWHPIRDLQRQAIRIAAGDYRIEPGVHYEEFVPIADSFSSMVRAVADREQAMRESEEKYRMLVQNAKSIIMRLDKDGCIRFFNEFAQVFFGYAEHEVLGRHVLGTIIADGDSAGAEFVDFAQNALARAERAPYHEHEHTTRSGERVWVAWTNQPLYDEQGNLNGVLCVGTDITVRKRLEDERLRSQKLESLGVLAGGIAHDFNNLLAAMLAHISLVQYRLPPGGKNQEDLEAAVNAIVRSRDLTRQLMTFSKGGMPVRKPIALNKLLVESTTFVLHGSNCRADFSIADDLRMVDADEAQIAQVVQNLVLNAAQAMPAGGVIQVSARNVELPSDAFEKLPAGAYVEISVRDAGSGIPEEIRDRIFDPYFTTKAQGTGLGLASVFSIVRNHGGYVTFQTGDGEGTVFVLYLPSIIAVAEENKMMDSPFGRLNGRVLLMDDEPGISKAIGTFLGELGLDVTLAADGAQAVEYFTAALREQRRYDIVILDLTVPGGMGGREAFQKMHEIDPQVRAVVTSGYSDDSTMSDYRSKGFQGALQKPYNLADLVAMIRSILQGAKGEQ